MGTKLDISTAAIVKVIAAAAAVWLVIELWYVILLVVIALVLVGTLKPMVAWLEAHRVPRGVALATIFVGFLGIVFLIGLLTIPALVAELADIMDKAPGLQARVAERMQHSKVLRPLAASVRSFRIAELMGAAGARILEWSQDVLVFIGEGMTTVFLAIYLVLGQERERGALFAIVPRTYHLRLARILANLETIVGGYVRGQLITSALMATFAFGLLSVLEVPNALALAVFAGLTDVLPFIGGLLATTPAVLAALAVGVPAAIGVLVAMIVYQELESRVIVPRVYGRALRLSAPMVIVALLAGGTLLGLVGALLALPVAAGIRMIVKELRVELPGEEEPSDSLRQRDAAAEEEYATRAAGTPAHEAAQIAAEMAEKKDPPSSQ